MKTYYLSKYVTAAKGKIVEAVADHEPDEDGRVLLRRKDWVFPIAFVVGKDAFESRAAAVKSGKTLIARKIKALQKQIETLSKKEL